MAYQLNISDKKAYEWLKKLIDNTLESPSSRPYQTSYEELMVWKEAFSECDRLREEAAEERKKARPASKTAAKQAPSKKRATRRKKKEISEFDCADHPTYGGMRMPRTDCSKCWSIYKKLHPMEYDRAWRKFKLKQRQNASD